jgi:hypothetical protein
VLAAADFLPGSERPQTPLIQRPVTMLQLRFKVGYVNACELAEDLEAVGFGRITCYSFGQRGRTLSSARCIRCRSFRFW